MAPFTPFITERVWQDLFATTINEPESVHLAAWPTADVSAINEQLSNHMKLVRRVVELGRGARAEAKAKTRQPLGRALVGASEWDSLSDELKSHVAEELNVQKIESLSSVGGDLVEVSIKANFRALGTKYGGAVQDAAKLIAIADAAKLVAEVRTTGSAKVGECAVTIDDLVITEVPKSGWSVASNNDESVALDLTLTQALINAGNVREVIRALQEGRKNAGFDISDRIVVTWNANNEVAGANQGEGAFYLYYEIKSLA